MTDDDYIFEIGAEGQQGLDMLDQLFNRSTQAFLQQSGLKPGMRVLEIGCGIGTMSVWLAQQVGEQGRVVAIDNNQYQVKATARAAEQLQVNNLEAIELSAYDLNRLQADFDLVYCRFVLHHLESPTQVVQQIFDLLPKGGIYVAEEGLVSQAFVYPINESWGMERWHNDPHDHETEGVARDGNFGMKLYKTMYDTGFRQLDTRLFQPVMQTKQQKSLFLPHLDETKRFFLESGKTEADWQKHCETLNAMVHDDSVMIGFYQSCLCKGVKG